MAFQARDYAGALQHANRAIALDQEFWIGHQMRGQALEELGDHDLALKALATAARLSGQNSKPISLTGYILGRSGRTAEARDLLGALEMASSQRYVPPYALALVHAGLGDADAAFEWLDRAYAARDVHLMFLTVDVKWDRYRSDPAIRRSSRTLRLHHDRHASAAKGSSAEFPVGCFGGQRKSPANNAPPVTLRIARQR